MKRSIILAIAFISILNLNTYSQCKEYIKAIAADELKPYILDGNFYAPVVYEGEKIEMTRTFLAGKKYKLKVLGMNFLEKQIKVTDPDGYILFANYQLKKNQKPLYYTNYKGEQVPAWGSNEWEFSLDQTTNLKITVKLEKKSRKKKDRLQGCLGIVVGFE